MAHSGQYLKNEPKMRLFPSSKLTQAQKCASKDLIFLVHEIFQLGRPQNFEILHYCWTEALC